MLEVWSLRPLDIPSPSSLEATQLQKLRELGKITSLLCGKRWLREVWSNNPRRVSFFLSKTLTFSLIDLYICLAPGGAMPSGTMKTTYIIDRLVEAGCTRSSRKTHDGATPSSARSRWAHLSGAGMFCVLGIGWEVQRTKIDQAKTTWCWNVMKEPRFVWAAETWEAGLYRWDSPKEPWSRPPHNCMLPDLQDRDSSLFRSILNFLSCSQ